MRAASRRTCYPRRGSGSTWRPPGAAALLAGAPGQAPTSDWRSGTSPAPGGPCRARSVGQASGVASGPSGVTPLSPSPRARCGRPARRLPSSSRHPAFARAFAIL
eukprot:scaffold9354_cov108-Isochrysis_galbana.AAC.7